MRSEPVREALGNQQSKMAPVREALGARKKSPEGLGLSFHAFMLALKVEENRARKCDAKN